MQSEQINELANALVKAQSAMKAATYNKVNPHFKNKYADLAAVIEAVRKPLCDNGLSVSQTTELIAPESFILRTTLYHTSGQWLACEYPLPSAANPQQLGSALTYARRYSLSCITCIAADEDDDGDQASATKVKFQPPESGPRKPPAPEQVIAEQKAQAKKLADAKKIQATAPHKLLVPVLANNAGPDFRAFAMQLLDAMRACPEMADIFEWQQENQSTIDEMQKHVPLMHKNLVKAIEDITSAAT